MGSNVKLKRRPWVVFNTLSNRKVYMILFYLISSLNQKDCKFTNKINLSNKKITDYRNALEFLFLEIGLSSWFISDNDAIIWPWNVILRVPHPSFFFFKMKCRCSESFFFSGRIRVNTPGMLSKWEYKKTSKDSKRKIGLSVIFTKKRRVM